MSARRFVLAAVCAVGLAPVPAHAQDADRIARATDLSIPSAPALALLDADPSTIVRPGFAEQYKLDLIVREDGLAPDLALALRPVWTFFFDDADIPSYRNRSALARAASTVTVSVGTAETDALRRIAWSVSFSVLRKDPLLDQDYVQGLSRLLAVSDRQQEIAQRQATEEVRARREVATVAAEAALSDAERTSRIAEIMDRLNARRAEFREQARAIEAALTEDVRAFVQDWRQRNWNATALDIGVGRLYEYTSLGIDSLDFAGAGFGAWATGATGFGTDRFLLSAMGRIFDVEGETRTSIGGNIRYGGPRFDAFIEYIFRESGALDVHEVGYGGGYRLDESRSVEFGLRTSYDSGFDLRALAPVVKLNWLIGKTKIEDLVLGRQ